MLPFKRNGKTMRTHAAETVMVEDDERDLFQSREEQVLEYMESKGFEVCSMCNGDVGILGFLGNRVHCLCRNCGWASSFVMVTA